MTPVEIARFPTRILAELARGRLEVDGIGAVLFDGGFAAIGPGALSEVRLMVDPADAARGAGCARAVITVASYNMRKGVGTDRRRDPLRTIEVLREIDADIVALQEADRRFGTKLSALPLDLLAEQSPYKPVPFDVRPGGIGWHGNALLVRRATEILYRCLLHLPVLEPRGAVMAELRVGGIELRVVGMHLDLSGLWRRRQARAVLGHIRARHRPMPTILMGDLNEWTLHGGCLREFVADWRIAPTGRSFHSRHPVACLDRIIVSPDVRIVSAGVHHSAKSGRASDHLPIWARLQPHIAA